MDSQILARGTVGACTIEAKLADITSAEVDAVVNAANSYLAHGGGLAGAIVRRGGDIIQQESNRLKPVAVGSAAVTSAGNLPARWVIHAVGPRWGEGEEEQKLRSAVRSSLDHASALGVRSIAMPAISTGIFGYPKREGTQVIVSECVTWLQTNHVTSLCRIELTAFDEETATLFARAVQATCVPGSSGDP
jgi:O-acetyl-ADP-ribose deacetylase (regulator of RNase III)